MIIWVFMQCLYCRVVYYEAAGKNDLHTVQLVLLTVHKDKQVERSTENILITPNYGLQVWSSTVKSLNDFR